MNSREAQMIMGEVRKAVIGKEACIRKIMMAILAGGHVLIDDIPGVGKTTMALAFARACGLKQNRIQFTPDILPSDITGFSIYKKQTGEFTYQPGAVMCNLLLADEINRTSPKTQSALLEVMEEGKITVDGKTRKVPVPFVVIATQNPVGSTGTQMLPESQMDRFMICISMGYPDMKDEIEIMKGKSAGSPMEEIERITTTEGILQMQQEVEQIFIHDAVYHYIAKIAAATRENPLLELGISPRGSLALVRMVKAAAYIAERNYVMPGDVTDVVGDVVLHRMRRNAKARAGQVSVEAILEAILEETPKPTPKRKQV